MKMIELLTPKQPFPRGGRRGKNLSKHSRRMRMAWRTRETCMTHTRLDREARCHHDEIRPHAKLARYHRELPRKMSARRGKMSRPAQTIKRQRKQQREEKEGIHEHTSSTDRHVRSATRSSLSTRSVVTHQPSSSLTQPLPSLRSPAYAPRARAGERTSWFPQLFSLAWRKNTKQNIQQMGTTLCFLFWLET